MRELSRLLLEFKKLENSKIIKFKDLLTPRNFDKVLLAVREIAGYNPVDKTFKSASLSMHLGTSLKLTCDELRYLILKESKGFECNSKTESQMWMKEVKEFRNLIDTRWNIEISSLAHKDLQEKMEQAPALTGGK